MSSIDKLLNWLGVLKRASRTRTILVQHKKDADVLQSIGVKNVVWQIEPDYKLVDIITNKECWLVFDANRPGNKACARTRALLERNGIIVSTRMRKLLFSSHIQELSGLLKKIHQELNTPRKHEAHKV